MMLQASNQRLKSRSPPVESARKLISFGFDSAEGWRKERASFTAPNRKLLCDPNNGVLGMNLPRCIWSTLNRLRTGHGRRGYLLHKWRFEGNPTCDFGNGEQTINHTVVDCQSRKFNQGFEGLHAVSPEAITWIMNLDIRL